MDTVDTFEKLRMKFREIIKERSISSIARELDMSPITLTEFLNGDRRPRYQTLKRMRDFIEKNAKGNNE